MELLANRNRDRQRTRSAGDRQGLISAIVIRSNAERYVVSDGSTSYTADTLLSERLREGDRVWIAVGRGTCVILGRQGRDVAFAETP